jgi:hypothetical protein
MQLEKNGVEVKHRTSSAQRIFEHAVAVATDVSIQNDVIILLMPDISAF